MTDKEALQRLRTLQGAVSLLAEMYEGLEQHISKTPALSEDLAVQIKIAGLRTMLMDWETKVGRFQKAFKAKT